MSQRLNKTYGLQGEPETRFQRELENIYKVKMDEQLVKYFSVPNVQTLPKEKPILVKVAGKWYTMIRIDDTLYKMTEWTPV